MKIKHNIRSGISLSSGFAVALALAVFMPGAVRAAQDARGAQEPMQMDHIVTQANAEALLPDDCMCLVCAKCKSVMMHKVTKDSAHVKMMTVNETFMCGGCGGTVEILATGKGEGKDAEVKHVCSKCGEDSMFCCAVKPGTGSSFDTHQKDIQGR